VRLSIVVPLVLAITIMAALAATAYGVRHKGGCERSELIGSSDSPDRRWTVRLERQVCSDGWLTTALTDTVLVAPLSASAQASRVLVIDDNGHDEDLPTMSWPGRSTLRIDVVGLAGIGLHLNHFGKLNIVLKKR